MVHSMTIRTLPVLLNGTLILFARGSGCAAPKETGAFVRNGQAATTAEPRVDGAGRRARRIAPNAPTTKAKHAILGATAAPEQGSRPDCYD
jgi:hypothetical protein